MRVFSSLPLARTQMPQGTQTITPAHLPLNPIRCPLSAHSQFSQREQQSHQHNDCAAPTYWQTNSSQAAEEAQRTRPHWVAPLNDRDKHAFRFINQTQQKENQQQQRGEWQWKWGRKNCKELAAKGSEITNEQIKCCRGFDAASKFSSGDKWVSEYAGSFYSRPTLVAISAVCDLMAFPAPLCNVSFSLLFY